MLVSTKDQGLGRRRRSYSHGSIYSNHRARVSKLALLSTATDQLRGLNGSNPTGGQDSYTKSNTIRRKSKKRKEFDRPPAMEAVHEETISDKEAKFDAETIVDEEAVVDEEADEKVDVFAFLVKEDEDAETERARDETALEDEGGHQPFHNTHSDFGISLHDDCCRMDQAMLKPLLPSLDEERQPLSSRANDKGLQTDRNWPEVPRPRHQMKVPGSDHEEPSPSFVDISMDPEHYMTESVCFTPVTSGFARAPPSILYDLLSKDRRDCSISPARCFKWANKRVLMHLQQEIFQLELEVKDLDRVIQDTNSPVTSATSSRRPSWQCNQQPLYSARAEVLDRLQVKLDTYNRMVITSTTLSNLAKSSPISLEKKDRIHAALRRHGEEEFAYLQSIFDDDLDLFSVLSRKEKLANEFSYSHVLTVFLSAVIPLLAFKMCSGLLIRVTIVALTVTMTLCGMTKLSNVVATSGIPFISTKFDSHTLKVWVLVGSAISLVGAFIC